MLARCELGGDHAPWDRLAAPQFPGPRRSPDEPAATDVPAVDTDIDPPVILSLVSAGAVTCGVPSRTVSLTDARGLTDGFSRVWIVT